MCSLAREKSDKSGVMGELCRIIRHLGSGIVSIIADNLSKAGWSWGCVATVDYEGRTIFVADAHRDDGKRFVVHADEKFAAFLEPTRLLNESAQ
jgi:hypothetical protein